MTTKNTKVISCRVSTEDYNSFAQLAKAEGYTLGEYLKNAIIKRLKRGVYPMKTIPGLKIEGNRIVGVVKPDEQASSLATLPLYNPAIHKPGDRVRIQKFGRWQTVTIPELDGDGHPI